MLNVITRESESFSKYWDSVQGKRAALRYAYEEERIGSAVDVEHSMLGCSERDKQVNYGKEAKVIE